MSGKLKETFIYPIDLVAIWVSITGLLGLFTLILSVFVPWVVLTIGFTTLVGAAYFLRARILWKDPRFSVSLWIILALALFFRLNPYLYFSAGQDQGLYVLMSNMFEVSHSLSFTDEFRASMDSDMVELYDRHKSDVMNSRVVSHQRSEYKFDFYPMTAVWLSLFSKLVGSERRTYSLVFFALLSIVGIYLIARDCMSPLAGYLAGGLMAINPYHVFFSKFPASEMTTLGLSTMALYYLTQMWKYRERRNQQIFYTVLSVVLFFSFCFSRITAVLYLPLFFIAVCFAMAYEPKKYALRVWYVYLIAILGTIFISAYFYYFFYRDTLYPTYNDMLFKRLGPSPTLTATLLLITVLVGIYPLSGILPRISWQKIAAGILRCMFIGIVAYSCLIMYQLGWGSYYKDHIEITNYRIYLRTSGWRLMTFWPLVTVLCMASPFAMGATIWHLFRRDSYRKNGILFIVFFHFLLFWGLIVFHNQFDFYHFYYTRYYVTEALPAVLLLSGCALSLLWSLAGSRVAGLGRYIGIAALVWGACLSSYQINGHEGPRLGFYKVVQDYVKKDDLLIYYDIPTMKEVIAPFRYFFNYKYTLNLAHIDEVSSPQFAKFAGLGKRIMLLTQDQSLGEKDRRFKPVTRAIFEYDFFFNNAIHLYKGSFVGASEVLDAKGFRKFPVPTNLIRKQLPLYLFEVILPQQ